MPNTRRTSSKPPAGSETGSVRVLKKYPNRRLYDTQSSSYITLADVKQMVLERRRRSRCVTRKTAAT